MKTYTDRQLLTEDAARGWHQIGPLAERRMALGLLGLGALLRVWQFAFNRSFWLDEAYLAVNFAERDLWALLTEPLANGQAAPLGFLLVTKLSYLFFGGADWSLRVAPLLSGLGTLLVAWPLGSKVWRHPLARIAFVGLVAFSPVLIYYASELKQYEGDVLVSMLLVWAGMGFKVDDLRAGLQRLALIGVVGVWLSHPSVFVLAAVGLILGTQCAVDRHGRAVAGLIVVGLLWVSSFALHYWLGVRAMATNAGLTEFWTMAYAPMPPFESGALTWYWENGLGLVYLAFRHVGIAHHLALPAWTDGQTVALAIFVFFGWLLSWRIHWRWMAILALPILLTLLASGLHLYPFRSRLILFLVPMVWMAAVTALDVALGMGWHRSASAHTVFKRVMSGVALLAALAMVLVELVPTAHHVLKPYNGSDIKGAMAFMAERQLPGDHLMLSTWSNKAYVFYQDAFGLSGMSSYVFRPTPNFVHDALATTKRACRAGESGRTWMLVSHRFDDRLGMLHTLQTMAPVLEQWEGDGAGAYVLDLAHTPFCARYRDAAVK